jgi:hypothetical protein
MLRTLVALILVLFTSTAALAQPPAQTAGPAAQAPDRTGKPCRTSDLKRSAPPGGRAEVSATAGTLLLKDAQGSPRPAVLRRLHRRWRRRFHASAPVLS